MDKDVRPAEAWEPDADYDYEDNVLDVQRHRNLHMPHVNSIKKQDPESQTVANNFLSKSKSQDVFSDKSDFPAFHFRSMAPLQSGEKMPRSEQGENESEDDSEGNPKTFMRVLTRFADRTSMQGVPYINVSSVWYAKAGWALLFLVGFVAMCFHLYYLMKEYYAYDTHSVVTLGFSTLSFPAVTICNTNPIKSSMMRLTTAELQAFVASVEPSNIAFSMEEKRKGEPGGNSEGGGSSSSSSSEEDYNPPDNHNEPLDPFEDEQQQQQPPGEDTDKNNEQPDPVEDTGGDAGEVEDTGDNADQTQPGEENNANNDQQSPGNDAVNNNNEQTTIGEATNANNDQTSPGNDVANNNQQTSPGEDTKDDNDQSPPDDNNDNNAANSPDIVSNDNTDATNSVITTTATTQLRTTTNSRSTTNNYNITTSKTLENWDEVTGIPSTTPFVNFDNNFNNSDDKNDTFSHTNTDTIINTTDSPNQSNSSGNYTSNDGVNVASTTQTTDSGPFRSTRSDKPFGTRASTRPTDTTTTTGSLNGEQTDAPEGNQPPPDKPRVRRRRFVEGFTISETNERYKNDNENDKNGINDNKLTGNKSTLRAIEDEFKFLFTSMGRGLRATIGHQIEDMLMECSFRGIECDNSYFEMTQTAEYGNCFTLERQDYVSLLGGPGDGLNMIFFTQDEEYLHGITNSLGFQVHIHQPGSWPNPYEEGISVSAGVETHIALKQVNIDRMGSPYGGCDPGETFSDKYGVTYTQKTCQQFCTQNLVMSRCNCFDNEKEEMFRRIESYKNTNVSRPCMSSNETTCLNKVYKDFQSGSITCDCPSPCDEKIYTKFTSTKQWPTEQYATILVEHLCNILNETECLAYSSKSRSDLALSFLKLVLYFEDLNYENITEEPNYELFQFVSDVGGTIGLWIGLSLISFFEVLQFFYEVVHYLVYVKPKQKAKLLKKRKLRQKQQSVHHAIRFSNDLLSQKNRLHTAAGKLKLAKSDSSKKYRKSRDGSQPSSETSSRNGKSQKSDGKAPPYDSVIANGGNYNADFFSYGRLNGHQNSRDSGI